MTARTHDIAAFTGLMIALSIVEIGQVSPGTAIAVLFANQIGGIIPDIDQPTAPFWRNLPVGGYLGKIFTKMLGGHRFITHSIIGLALIGWLLSLLLGFIQPLTGSIDLGFVWWACMIGVVSHLVLDSFTKEGVPWLLPIPIKFGFPPIKQLRITTGKKGEYLFFYPLLVVITLIVCINNYEALSSLI